MQELETFVADQDGEDIEVTVHFEYLEGQVQTFDEPGFDDEIIIHKVVVDGVDIMHNLAEETILELENECLESIKDDWEDYSDEGEQI